MSAYVKPKRVPNPTATTRRCRLVVTNDFNDILGVIRWAQSHPSPEDIKVQLERLNHEYHDYEIHEE